MDDIFNFFSGIVDSVSDFAGDFASGISKALDGVGDFVLGKDDGNDYFDGFGAFGDLFKFGEDSIKTTGYVDSNSFDDFNSGASDSDIVSATANGNRLLSGGVSGASGGASAASNPGLIGNLIGFTEKYPETAKIGAGLIAGGAQSYMQQKTLKKQQDFLREQEERARDFKREQYGLELDQIDEQRKRRAQEYKDAYGWK